MVFLWFAVFPLPSGMIMGRIGRKKTVLLSALPPLMGIVSDASSQLVSLLVPFAALVIILVMAYYVIKN